MRIDAEHARRALAAALAATSSARPVAALRGVRGLVAPPTAEHRAVAVLFAEAMAEGDFGAALALASTAGRRADLRAEKILSRRYRFLWICNPKVASRSMIAALRAADPDALLIRGRTLDRVLAQYPEAKRWYRFAFLRHPCDRIRSFHADKYALARRARYAYHRFIKPWHGVGPDTSFAELCRWLATPCGSDVFADRHWLSQSRQVVSADGRLPDFLGRYESLEEDWRGVTQRLGLPPAKLPRLNARPVGMDGEAALDAEAVALLERRYAGDFRLGGYAEGCR